MREGTSAIVEQGKKIKKLYLHITLFAIFARLLIQHIFL